MNYYEKVMIIDSNVDDSAVEEIVAKIRDIITGQGGEILKTDKWGRRKLAYELNKQQKGNYVLLLFKSPPSTIGQLEKHCKLSDVIIKFMVVKLTKKKQIEAVLPSAEETKEKTSAASESAEEKEAAQPAESATSPEGS